jgi:2-iminoacetate synthase
MPGFIQNMCTPNALLTLQEYLTDFASPETRLVGEALIQVEAAKLSDSGYATPSGYRLGILDRLERIRDAGERDLYF